MKTTLSLLRTACFAACAPIVATATIQLPDMVVLSRPSIKPWQTTLNPRTTMQPAPANDGADLLRTVPGFALSRQGGAGAEVIFRGMSGSRIGLLTNGAPIQGGCPHRMDPPTSYLFPSDYQEVTIIKGPQTVRYGMGNSAGVVIFETKPSHFEKPSFGGSAGLLFGSYGKQEQSLQSFAGNSLGYVKLTGSHAAAGNYQDGRGRSVAANYNRWSSEATLGWTPTQQAALEFFASFSDGEAATPTKGMDASKLFRRNLGSRLEIKDLTREFKRLSATVTHSYINHVMDDLSLRSRSMMPTMMPTMAPMGYANPDVQQWAGRVETEWEFSDSLSAIYGIDGVTSKHRSRSSNANADYRTKAYTPDLSTETAGAFSEWTWKFNPQNRLVAGARLQHWSTQDDRTRVATSMMSSAANPTAKQKNQQTLGAGFFRWEADQTREITTYAGVGFTERAPDYWELIQETSTSLSALQLSPEKTLQLDAGASYRNDSFTANASIFANQIHNFILFQSFSKTMGMMSRQTTIARNIDAWTCGSELQGSWKFTENWLTDASLTYTYAENSTDHRPLAQIPPLEARLGISYQAKTWSARLFSRMAHSLDRYAKNQGTLVGLDQGPNPGFATFSCSASYHLTASTTLHAGLDNLLNQTYSESVSRTNLSTALPNTSRITEPGRTFWIKLEQQF